MATTREQARTALVNKVEELKALWTAYPLIVDYSNLNTVNTSTQTDPYLCVSMVYQDGMQIDLSTKPSHRVMGVIVLEAKVRGGAGTKLANELLEFFYPHLHMTDVMVPLRTSAARFASTPVTSGWATEAAIIPFWYDSFQ